MLKVNEPPAFEIVNPEGLSNTILVCDHASNRVPIDLKNLGLNTEQLADHIAWDLGAADVARALSKLIDAPLILSGYSRLVIDCNRPLSSHESIPEQTAEVDVPGNKNLTSDDRNNRVDTFFWPYHNAIKELLNKRQNPSTILLSIHSFTPVLHQHQRPWHIGISHKKDNGLAKFFYQQLSQLNELNVGFNQPYPIEDEFDYTIPTHGDGRNIPNIMIEIRQNTIQTTLEASAWAERLAQVCTAIKTGFEPTL